MFALFASLMVTASNENDFASEIFKIAGRMSKIDLPISKIGVVVSGTLKVQGHRRQEFKSRLGYVR